MFSARMFVCFSNISIINTKIVNLCTYPVNLKLFGGSVKYYSNMIMNINKYNKRI